MKKTLKVLAVVLCLTVSIAMLAACGSSSSSSSGSSSSSSSSSSGSTTKATLKIACSAGDTSTWVKGLKNFKKNVEADTDGNVKVEIYSSDQLTNGDQVAGIQAVIDGTTDMSLHSNIIWSSIDEKYAVVSLPFLFKSTDDADKVIDGDGGQDLKDALADQGVQYLACGENGFRHVTNSKRAIATPKDMKGLKIRVAGSTVLMDAYKAWGADYTKANWSEVYTGLQTGTYDGQENPLPTADSSSIQEVQKYCTYWTGSYDVLFFTMNKAKWDSFDKDTQDIIQKDATKAMDYQKKINREEDQKVIKKWKKAGIKFHNTTDAEMNQFKKLSDSTYDSFEKRIVKAGMSQSDADKLMEDFGAK